jgi:hypothetical protein
MDMMFTPKRQVFVTNRPSDILPTPEPYADIESLREAWDILKEALSEADKRLKKIRDAYGGEAKIPSEVRAEYEAYKSERDDTKRQIAEIEKQGVWRAEAGKSIDEETETVARTTLEELDAAFAAYAGKQHEKEQIDRYDPAAGLVTPLFEATPVKHVSRRKSRDKEEREGQATPESEEKKGSKSKESPEYWAALYRDITRKIINKASSGNEEPLSVEERTAVMFMKGGETREIRLDDKKYLLERDIPGKFLRLRNYWRDNGKDDAEKQQEDPYMASSGAKDALPVWKNVTDTDRDTRSRKQTEEAAKKSRETEERRFEDLKVTYRKEIENIFAPETPAGSVALFKIIESKEPIAGTDSFTVTRVTVELTKKYGGEFTARILREGVTTDAEGIESNPKILNDETKHYDGTQMEACTEEIMKLVNPGADYTTYVATPDQTEAERLEYVHKQLEWMAGNLVGSSIFAGEEVIYHDDATGGEWIQRVNKDVLAWLGRIQRLIDKENITDWEQDPMRGYIGRHILIRDGKISMLQDNPAYDEYRKRIEAGGKKPKSVPEQYLAIMKDVRLREDQLPPEMPEKRVA